MEKLIDDFDASWDVSKECFAFLSLRYITLTKWLL